MSRLSHIGKGGEARMVDVSRKRPTRRKAVAESFVQVGAAVASLIAEQGAVSKDNVLETARLAGIMAAKSTWQMIPMCHPVALELVELRTELSQDQVRLVATVAATGRTGVEMEAMTAASVAALTVYDMVKSAGKGITIGPVRLLLKEGGKSGRWRRDQE
jgi:cyclic pyranopterin monophosphate synthase